jgi:hypothetical protein
LDDEQARSANFAFLTEARPGRGGVPGARLVIEPERLHEVHHRLLGGRAI